MKNPLLSFVLAAAIFAISPGNVANAGAAQSINNFIKQAEVIKVNAVNSANSISIKVSTTIKGFAANDPYQIKTVDVPKSNFMGHIRGSSSGGIGGLVKKNAWYAAWFATMAAAGWAIDELHNQVVTKPKPADQYFGTCTLSSGTIAVTTIVNMTQCLAKQKKWDLARFTPSTVILISPVNDPPLKFYVEFNNNDSMWDYFYITNPTLDSSVSGSPVPDDALYDSLISKMLEDPKAAAQAFMVPDPYPYPYPNIFPSQIPYIPGVSEADQEALDLYYKGLLQSTNPNAPYYVTPERYQQIAQLAQQLQQGQTPEGQTDAMNDQVKKPLTQKELEESLKKEREAQEKAIKESLGEKPSFDKLTEPLDKFVENVNKTPQDEINSLPQNTFGIAGSGTCYKIEKPISIMGVTVNMSTRSFCDAYYYPYFLPILTWFFYIATGLYIWFSLRDAYSRRI
jgi:hypothetical protein